MMKSFLRKAQLTASVSATQEPLQVVGLTATASGQTTINLSWTADATPAPNGATSYDVERSVDGLLSWSTIATGLTTNSYSDTSLSASQTRYYRVSAYNSFGGGLPSAPANATTAAGSLSPSWTLDFSSGTPSGYTLTRASSATRVDSSGYIASSSTDVARLTHNSSGSRLGLLVEESRTNSFQRSEEFDNAYWTKTGLLAFGSGSTANAATAPDNTTTADLITEDSGGTSGHFVQRGSLTFNASTSYTMSMFVKKPSSNARDFVTFVFSGASGHRLVRTFDLADGTSTRNNWAGANFSTESSGSEQYRDGWWRLWISVTIGGTNVTSVTAGVATATSETPTLIAGGTYPNHAGDGVSGLLIWGAQLEANATMSSYIPTTTASVTRSADLAHVLDSSITSWGDPGALVVHFYPPGQAGTLISTDDAATAQVGIEASPVTDVRAFWSSNFTAAETLTTGVQKAIHYWNGTNSRLCLNGGTVQSGTNNLTIANTDFVTLGAEATESGGVPGTFSQYANCVIRKVEFYTGTLTDANLQTITT